MNGYEMTKVVEKPWGKEEWIDLTDKYCLKKITIYSGCATSLQYHKEKKETTFIHAGKALVTYEEPGGKRTQTKVGPGYILRLDPLHIHRIEALDEDVLLFEASTIEVNDVVRLEDSYGRKGTSNP